MSLELSIKKRMVQCNLTNVSCLVLLGSIQKIVRAALFQIKCSSSHILILKIMMMETTCLDFDVDTAGKSSLRNTTLRYTLGSIQELDPTLANIVGRSFRSLEIIEIMREGTRT